MRKSPSSLPWPGSFSVINTFPPDTRDILPRCLHASRPLACAEFVTGKHFRLQLTRLIACQGSCRRIGHRMVFPNRPHRFDLLRFLQLDLIACGEGIRPQRDTIQSHGSQHVDIKLLAWRIRPSDIWQQRAKGPGGIY